MYVCVKMAIKLKSPNFESHVSSTAYTVHYAIASYCYYLIDSLFSKYFAKVVLQIESQMPTVCLCLHSLYDLLKCIHWATLWDQVQ
jgi:hypothetical protein